MALSGSATKAIGSHWFLDIEWTATQSVSGNSSTITANLYWRCDSYGAVSSSATKDGNITIGSYVSTFSGAGLASLSGGQKKKIHTYTKTISHDSAGNLSVVISGMFDMNVNLSGTTYTNQTVSDGTQTLNTIPRASSITSSASWTFPNSVPYTIAENSSSFTHKIEVYVNSNLIKTVSGITGTSGTITFTDAENQEILLELNKDTTNWNQATIVRLYTYNSATQTSTYQVGSYDDATGTCSSPTASTLGVASFDIGTTTTYDINGEKNTGFHYDLTAQLGTYTKTLLTKSDVSTLTDIVWNTSTDKTSLMNALPTANSGTVTWTLTTYFDNAGTYTKIRSAVTATCTATIATADRNPSWTDNMTWADVNSTTNTLKGAGNEAIAIQGKSIMEFTLQALATPKTGATISRYEVTMNGYTKTINQSETPTVGKKFPQFTASEINNTTLSAVVKVIDSRNNVTQYPKTITVIPYAPPVATLSATRVNGFEDNTIATLTGNISLVTISSVDKNSIFSTSDPTTAPTLSVATNAGSTLVAGTYYATYTWVNAYGETLASPQSTGLTVATGQNLIVTIPAKPSGATSANIYISTTSGSTRLQGSTTTTTYTRSTAVSTSATLASSLVYSASALQYRSRLQGGTWSGYKSFKFTMNGANYTATNVTLVLDKMSSWEVEVKVTDSLSSTIPPAKIVPVGQPILFMDSAKKSIGVNRFPSTRDFEVENGIKATALYGHYMDATMVQDHMNGNVTINAQGNHLYLGYYNTTMVRLYQDMYDSGGTRKIIGKDGSGNFTYITLDNTLDASANSTGAGIQIGTNTGQNLKIDGNEIASYNNGVGSDLYLNNDGGNVFIGNTIGSTIMQMPKGVIFIPNAVGTYTTALRLVTDSANAYIQAGKDLNDTSASLVIARTGTSGSNLADVTIRSDNTHFWGEIILENARTICFSPYPNYDQLWYNDTDNYYHFTGDAAGSKTTGQANLRATSFNTTSDRKFKENIRDFTETFSHRAIDKVKGSNIRTYNYKHDLERKKKGRKTKELSMGLIADEAPTEILSYDGEAVDLYAMSSMLWRAVQELSEEVEYLEKKLKQR